MSMLCAQTPDLMAMLADADIHFLWHPSLSEESGAEAVAVLDRCLSGA